MMPEYGMNSLYGNQFGFQQPQMLYGNQMPNMYSPMPNQQGPSSFGGQFQPQPMTPASPFMYNQQMPNTSQPQMNLVGRSLESLYPEVYNLIYPAIKQACDSMSGLNGMNPNSIHITTLNQISETIYNTITVEDLDETASSNDVKETIAQDPNMIHGRERFLLRDLIRILLIRELIKRGIYYCC